MDRPLMRKWRDTCYLCGHQYPVEKLTWAEWFAPSGSSTGCGLCCPGCWHDLPHSLVISGSTWLLIGHPY